MKDITQKQREEFENLTPNYDDVCDSYDEGERWLKNNPHLFTGNMYDEPAFTLDKNKVWDWHISSLNEFLEEVKKKLKK